MQRLPINVLVPMSEAEYADFVARTICAFAAQKVAAGHWTAAESLEQSRKSLVSLLPKGRASDKHHFYTIRDNDRTAVVGHLWIAEQERAGQRVAYVYDVDIRPDYRRAGHASRAFAALEAEAQRLGLCGVVLHVFAHNHPARALYEKLGFAPTDLTLYKPLGSEQGAKRADGE